MRIGLLALVVMPLVYIGSATISAENFVRRSSTIFLGRIHGRLKKMRSAVLPAKLRSALRRIFNRLFPASNTGCIKCEHAQAMFVAARAREWHATKILAALNDLQSRSGETISRAEFLAVWQRAWNAPPTSPPELTLEQLRSSVTAVVVPDWQVDELAAQIDPGAFLDDGVVLGSVVGRREAARRRARAQLQAAAMRRTV
jgi:hypothetical protein